MEGEGSGGGSADAAEPRDARMVKEVLCSMGLAEGYYEPRVVHQFLELCYRYVVDVLSDAQIYSDHAGKSTVDADDVRLSIQSMVNSSFSQPPPREVLLELARNRNKIPLPKLMAPPGSIPLPPEKDALISSNYQLLLPSRKPPSHDEETEVDEDPNPNPNTSPYPNMVQEQRMSIDNQQKTPQRVSFPLSAAATNFPR